MAVMNLLKDSHLTLTIKNAIQDEYIRMIRTIIPKSNISFHIDEYLSISNLGFITFKLDTQPNKLRLAITNTLDRNKDFRIWSKEDINNGLLRKYERSNLNVEFDMVVDGNVLKVQTYINNKFLVQDKKFQKMLNLYIYEYDNLLCERYILVRQFFRHRASILEKEFLRNISKKIPEDLILYIYSYIGDWYQNESIFSYLDSLVKNIYDTTMT